MKTYLIRIIAILLVSLMMIFAVGCDLSSLFVEIEENANENFKNLSNNQKNSDSTDESTRKPITSGNLQASDVDVSGQELVILVQSDERIAREWYKDIQEDNIDSMVVERNNHVTNELGLKLNYSLASAYTAKEEEAFYDKVAVDVFSGTHQYDILAYSSEMTASLAIRGCADNLLNTYQFPYFNFSLPCWNQSLIENTTVNGKLFYLAGDINSSLYDTAAVVFFNRKMYQNIRTQSDPPDIQSAALNGAWTYEDLFAWSVRSFEHSSRPTKASSILVNSDKQFLSAAIPAAWDLDLMVRDTSDTYRFNINGNTKASNAVDKFVTLVKDRYGTSDIFTASQALFYMSELYTHRDINSNMRSMSDSYGILPIPKYTSDQQAYKTSCGKGHSLIMVLDHSNSSVPTKGGAISSYLQVSAEFAYNNLRPNYYASVVEPYVKTSDYDYNTDFGVFNLIADSIELDFMSVYSPQLFDAYYLWSNAIDRGSLTNAFELYYTDYSNANKSTKEWLLE